MAEYREPQGKRKSRYGIDFPGHLTDFNIELMCWKHWREPVYRSGNLTNPHDCFFKAMRMTVNGVPILTPDEWKISRWSEEHVYDWTMETGIIVWGCAASGKSWEEGLLTLMDWSVDPNETIALMASTSKESLLKRTFAAVVHYHSLFRQKGIGLPGKWTPSKYAITLGEEDSEEASIKTGVWGIAVKDGSTDEAVGRIRGMHAAYVRLIVDELSAMPPAVWDPKLRHNLRVGARDLKVVGLTNIDSFEDLAGRNSEPLEGWSSVNIEVERWRTLQGVVRRHDGYKSPALEPGGAEKFPHLLNRVTLDAAIAEEGGNPDAPALVAMYRAWPPDVNSKQTIVSSAETVKWGMRRVADAVPQWISRPTVVAGLDGSAGGDTVALQFAYVGIVASGKWEIWFEPEEAVPIKGKGGAPVTEQIWAYCEPRFKLMELSPEHLGVDDTAAQGLCDFIAVKWSNALRRFNYGSSAGDLPVSAFNKEPAKDRYADTATELGFLYRMYGQYGQLKNVGVKALRQLTSREIIHRGGKQALVDKKKFKKDTGQRSPDEMDSGAMALAVVRYVVGLAPGSTEVLSGPYEAHVNPYQELDQSQVADLNNLKSDYGVNNA